MGDDDIDLALTGALLSLLAHDLRNPLAALRSNVSFAHSAVPEGDSDTREALEDSQIACDGLTAIIENIDWLGRSLRNEAPRLEPLPLVGVVRDALEKTRSAAVSHGRELEFEPSGGDVWGVSDRAALTVALSNLIRNSIQHGAGQPVVVSVLVEGERAVIRVKDGGPGMDEEAFRLSTRAGGQLSAKGQSAARYSHGLSLYVARLAASLASASLSARPASPQGNEFSLSVPLRT